MGGYFSNSQKPYCTTLDVKEGDITTNYGNNKPEVPLYLHQAAMTILTTAKKNQKFNNSRNGKKLVKMIYDVGASIMLQYNGVDFDVTYYEKGRWPGCKTTFVVIKVKPSHNFKDFSHVRRVPLQNTFTLQPPPMEYNLPPQNILPQVQHPDIEQQVPMLHQPMQMITQQESQLQPVQQLNTKHENVQIQPPQAPVVVLPLPQKFPTRPEVSTKIVKNSIVIMNLSFFPIYVKIVKDKYHIKKVEKKKEAGFKLEFDIPIINKGIKTGLEGKSNYKEERKYNEFINEKYENVLPNNYCQGPDCVENEPFYISVYCQGQKVFIANDKRIDPFKSVYVMNNGITQISNSDAVKYLQQNKII